MSGSLSKSLHFSPPVKIKTTDQKQGIVTILGSNTKEVASLRRTLSADMSSKKWLAQNGLISPMKKISSSEEFSLSNHTRPDSSSSSSDEEEEEDEERTQSEIWRSIQQEKEKKKGGECELWSSILSKDSDQDSSKSSSTLPSPYIHPLVKRSKSSLSETSLKICTESLGSETGADGFSSYSASETEDVAEEDKAEEITDRSKFEKIERPFQREDDDEWRPFKYNNKRAPARSFPPPLPSLSRPDGASVRMQSRRNNGRLILEAISVPSQNNFRTERQDGRLVLSLVNKSISSEEDREEEFDEKFVDFEEEREEKEIMETESEEDEDDDDDDERFKIKEMEIVMKQEPKLPNGMLDVHRLAIMMNKSNKLANTKNPTWPRFNEVVRFEEGDETEKGRIMNATPVTRSLPPRPKVAPRRLMPSPPPISATASLNTYEYYWRKLPPTVASTKLISSKNTDLNDQQNLVVLRSNNGDDCLVSLSKSCKEARRSLLFMEPHCIATS